MHQWIPDFLLQFDTVSTYVLILRKKSSHSIAREWNDVGYLSVCCEYVLLPLVNKEADLAYGRQNIAKRKTRLNAGTKETESGKYHVATQKARGNKP